MWEKWPSFPQRGSLGILGLLVMVGSQEREVRKEFQGCTGEEEIQGEMDQQDFTEDSRGEMVSLDILGSLGLRAHQAQEELLVFQGFQVTRVSQACQGLLDSQAMMEQADLKETKVTLPVSMVHLVQRVSQGALDAKETSETLETKACLELLGREDHPESQDHLAPSDHQGVQVIQGYLGWRAILEK